MPNALLRPDDLQEEMLLGTVAAGVQAVVQMLVVDGMVPDVQLHHGGRPLPLDAHDHVGVVAADVAVEDVAVGVDEVVVMLQAEVFEDFIDGLRHRAIEFRALHRFKRTNFLVSPPFLGGRLIHIQSAAKNLTLVQLFSSNFSNQYFKNCNNIIFRTATIIMSCQSLGTFVSLCTNDFIKGFYQNLDLHYVVIN